MTMIFLDVFVAYIGILCVSLLSQSLGTTILALLFVELGTSIYLWVVVLLDSISSHVFGPVAVRNGPAIAIVTVQAFMAASATAATVIIQSRKRDFV